MVMEMPCDTRWRSVSSTRITLLMNSLQSESRDQHLTMGAAVLLSGKTVERLTKSKPGHHPRSLVPSFPATRKA
jgi:hypothetical protein